MPKPNCTPGTSKESPKSYGASRRKNDGSRKKLPIWKSRKDWQQRHAKVLAWDLPRRPVLLLG